MSTSERSLITLIICDILAQYHFDNWNIQMKEIGTIKNKKQIYLNSCQTYLIHSWNCLDKNLIKSHLLYFYTASCL